MAIGGETAQRHAGLTSFSFDRLGLLVGALVLYGALVLPFATFRANRIVAGEGHMLWTALPVMAGVIVAIVMIVAVAVSLAKTRPILRLLAAVGALLALFVFIGMAGAYLVPAGDRLARVSPASGFWVLVLAFAVLMADALVRMALSPLLRIALLCCGIAAGVALLSTGLWDSLSIMKEYANRADSFRAEGVKHLVLAFGSMAAAVAVGLPLGLLCHRIHPVRVGALNVLSVIQTIPSIALFGLLIAPLGWLAANVPAAAALGIRGIGTAPAFVALFLYSLLPVVANTVAGLASVPKAINDAARGMGMTAGQRLVRIELPLAFPVLLTAIRIVLVQNIGLATIAALIGGGGFGVFVFQGVGQTAMDLVLLGAVPTVILAFSAAIVLDALVELVSVPTTTQDQTA